MAAHSETLQPVAGEHTLSMRWVISGRDDLVWFIGSVTVSYLFLYLYAGGLIPLLPMMAVWAVGIDGPHVFGTISRTYLDRSEWKNRKRLLLGSLLFFLVGPLLVTLGFSIEFFFVAALWAYYHLVKQHYGFMVLYKKKNGDLLPVDNALDRALILLALTAPFLAYILRDPEAIQHVPPALRGAISTLYFVVLTATLAIAAIWLARQFQRLAKGLALNVPKYLLLGAAISMHWVALLTPMANKTIALVAILTVYHNIQYHRLIWFHNRKYSPTADSRAVYGPASLINRSLLSFALSALIFGILYQGPRQYLLAQQLNGGPILPLAISFLWGFAFNHYYLDSKIWRIRRDPGVGQALKIV